MNWEKIEQLQNEIENASSIQTIEILERILDGELQHSGPENYYEEGYFCD